MVTTRVVGGSAFRSCLAVLTSVVVLASATAAAAAGAAVGVISTSAGTGTGGFNGDLGPATSSHINYPQSAAVTAGGDVYVADTNDHRIRRIAYGTGIITTYAGTGTGGFLGDTGPATSARLTSRSAVH